MADLICRDVICGINPDTGQRTVWCREIYPDGPVIKARFDGTNSDEVFRAARWVMDNDPAWPKGRTPARIVDQLLRAFKLAERDQSRT